MLVIFIGFADRKWAFKLSNFHLVLFFLLDLPRHFKGFFKHLWLSLFLDGKERIVLRPIYACPFKTFFKANGDFGRGQGKGDLGVAPKYWIMRWEEGGLGEFGGDVKRHWIKLLAFMALIRFQWLKMKGYVTPLAYKRKTYFHRIDSSYIQSVFLLLFFFRLNWLFHWFLRRGGLWVRWRGAWASRRGRRTGRWGWSKLAICTIFSFCFCFFCLCLYFYFWTYC